MGRWAGTTRPGHRGNPLLIMTTGGNTWDTVPLTNLSSICHLSSLYRTLHYNKPELFWLILTLFALQVSSNVNRVSDGESSEVGWVRRRPPRTRRWRLPTRRRSACSGRGTPGSGHDSGRCSLGGRRSWRSGDRDPDSGTVFTAVGPNLATSHLNLSCSKGLIIVQA